MRQLYCDLVVYEILLCNKLYTFSDKMSRICQNLTNQILRKLFTFHLKKKRPSQPDILIIDM